MTALARSLPADFTTTRLAWFLRQERVKRHSREDCRHAPRVHSLAHIHDDRQLELRGKGIDEGESFDVLCE